MTGITPVKKFLLSVSCAFMILMYVPVACLVGNDIPDDIDYAQAENPTCVHLSEDGEMCENCEVL
ncbi:MAG: hypothetical protein IJO68_03720 [Clostridia bacterium]|nr:hypothetical protein [Clostridia bacterium]